jgi:nucleoside recognition membrane protein YjiH
LQAKLIAWVLFALSTYFVCSSVTHAIPLLREARLWAIWGGDFLASSILALISASLLGLFAPRLSWFLRASVFLLSLILPVTGLVLLGLYACAIGMECF